MRMNRTRAVTCGLLALGLTVLAIPAVPALASGLQQNAPKAESLRTSAEIDAETEQREAEPASLNDALDAVGSYLETSGWTGYSQIAATDNHIVVRGVDAAPEAVLKHAQELAGEFAVVSETVPFTEQEYIAVTDRLMEALGEDGRQLQLVSMRGNQKIRIELIASERSTAIEETTRTQLKGYPFEIVPADGKAVPVPAVGRQADASS